MYDQVQFGKELQKKVKDRVAISEIGNWAFSVYVEYMLNMDFKLRSFLLQLGIMEMGPEFERSYEELEDIADRLIAGEDVKL